MGNSKNLLTKIFIFTTLFLNITNNLKPELITFQQAKKYAKQQVRKNIKNESLRKSIIQSLEQQFKIFITTEKDKLSKPLVEELTTQSIQIALDTKSNTKEKVREDEDYNNICIICHESYEPGVRVAILTCGHRFHETCIKSKLTTIKIKIPLTIKKKNGHIEFLDIKKDVTIAGECPTCGMIRPQIRTIKVFN